MDVITSSMTTQEQVNMVIEERLRQIVSEDAAKNNQFMFSGDSKESSNDGGVIVNNKEVQQPQPITAPTHEPITVSQTPQIPQAPIMPTMESIAAVPELNVLSDNAPTTITNTTEKKSNGSGNKRNSKNSVEDMGAFVNETISKWNSMSNLEKHDALLKIMGKSSSGIAKSLNLAPGNIIMTSIRGGRQLKGDRLELVYNAFYNDNAFAAYPQLKALITREIFLSNVKEDGASS